MAQPSFGPAPMCMAPAISGMNSSSSARFAAKPPVASRTQGARSHARQDPECSILFEKARDLHAVEQPDARMARRGVPQHRVQLASAFGRRGVQPRHAMTWRSDVGENMDRQAELLGEEMHRVGRAGRDRVDNRFVRGGRRPSRGYRARSAPRCRRFPSGAGIASRRPGTGRRSPADSTGPRGPSRREALRLRSALPRARPSGRRPRRPPLSRLA